MINFKKFFKINVWVNPDKSLKSNDFVGPPGKFVLSNDEFGLKRVEQIASASKVRRLIAHPFRYVYAILHRKLVYRFFRTSTHVQTKTWFGKHMHLLLPSSTDIYLTGGKSHDSEIRLARFMLQHLQEGDSFLDIGAHYGYFTLLAAALVGEEGNVIAIEAAPNTFKILQKNTRKDLHISAFNLAVSNTNEVMTFYEFPNLYAEYNSTDIEQFRNEKWFAHSPPKAIPIQAVMMDDFLADRQFVPTIIKIDVEGAEYQVMQGMQSYLVKNDPMIVMEYLSASRGNASHIKAAELLYSSGYQSFIISPTGSINPVTDINAHLSINAIDSDNIVFLREKKLTSAT